MGRPSGLAVTGIAAGDIDAQLVAVAPDELELAGAIGFVFSQALWVPSLFLILTLGLLLFPDGAFPSPRWRWVGWFAGLSITALTSYFAWGARPWSDSPYITSNDERLELIPSIVLPMLVVATMASLVGLVVRFRRSTGELRQQFRWVTWGLAILAVATASLIPISIDIFKIVGLPAIALLGISYGVAITKYRLYEIDVVLNRSLVFAVLAAFITGVYAIVVVGLGSWLGGRHFELAAVYHGNSAGRGGVRARTGSNPALCQQDRLRRPSDAISGARRSDHAARQHRIDGRTSRTHSAAGCPKAPERHERFCGWMETNNRPPSGRPKRPRAPEEGEFTVSIMTGDIELGTVSVLKGRGELLTPTERALVKDLAGSAGMVLNRARLAADLEARAEELRVSRRRLVDAQAEERRRLERDLHDGAQQQVVALKVKLGLAQRFAEQEGSEESAKFIRQMAHDAQAAIDEIQSLGKGIFPPLLESDGLRAAVSAGAANAPIPVIVKAQDLGRYDPEIEAAAYFCITEAITNSIKYSGSNRIDVRLANATDGLHFVVGDEGQGFDSHEASHGQRPRGDARSPGGARWKAHGDVIAGQGHSRRGIHPWRVNGLNRSGLRPRIRGEYPARSRTCR